VRLKSTFGVITFRISNCACVIADYLLVIDILKTYLCSKLRGGCAVYADATKLNNKLDVSATETSAMM